MNYTVGRIIYIYCNQEGYRDKQRFFPPRLHEMSRQSDISTDPFDADGIRIKWISADVTQENTG